MILIYGAGVIGRATGFGFERLGHEVTFYDISQDVLKDLRNKGHQVTSKPVAAEICFICVPEAVIQDAVNAVKNMVGLCVIRSTVPVGTTSEFNDKFKGNPVVIHNPEFLREGVANFEFMNPKVILVGDDIKAEDKTKLLLDLYDPFKVPKFILTSKETEMLKLVLNAYLSCQISFWNEIFLICKDLNINSLKLGHILKIDPRISYYGSSMHGSSFGGKCLPKDLKQITELAKRETPLLDAIQRVNEIMQAIDKN